MNLREILKHVSGASVIGTPDREICGVTHDSRRVFPGMIFVAVRGLRVDGHDFLQAAVERGASVVVAEQAGVESTRATSIRVDDSRRALAEIAASFHGFAGRRLKMIGVTGTSGKTTVSFLIKHLLEQVGMRTGLIGTVRYEIGDRVIPAQRTTPEAPEIHQMLAQMVRSGCAACVMEVSSHALAQKRVWGLDFDLGVFTNLTRDHLDYHGTIDKYFEVKRSFFTAMEQGADTAAMVINLDDPYGARLVAEVSLNRQWTYGLKEPVDLRATDISLDRTGTRMRVETNGQTFDCATNLIGRHNVYNTLAAIGAGLALDLSAENLCRGLASVAAVPGRLEQVDHGQPFGIYVDYAHTDDALRNVLTTLREITDRRILLVFGCGGNRDPGKRHRMGEVAAELADCSIVTSDNPRRESPEQIVEAIAKGFTSVKAEGPQIQLDRQRAIDEIIRMAQPGDTVLIAGKGHETYQEFENTVVPFDDRLCARDTLETLGWPGGESS